MAEVHNKIADIARVLAMPPGLNEIDIARATGISSNQIADMARGVGIAPVQSRIVDISQGMAMAPRQNQKVDPTRGMGMTLEQNQMARRSIVSQLGMAIVPLPNSITSLGTTLGDSFNLMNNPIIKRRQM